MPPWGGLFKSPLRHRTSVRLLIDPAPWSLGRSAGQCDCRTGGDHAGGGDLLEAVEMVAPEIRGWVTSCRQGRSWTWCGPR